jgi:uncharacterized protein
MRAVFVDTGAFYALSDSGEATHAIARETLKELERKGSQLLTTTDVVDEIVTLVRYRLGHAPAVTLGQKLFESSWCRIVEISDEIRSAAWEIFIRYDDQRFSLTDCTSFATMHAEQLSEAFTFDRNDFLAAGFRVIPDPEQPAPRARSRRRRK